MRTVETKKYTFDKSTSQKWKRVLLALQFVHVIAERTFTNVTSLIDANIENLHLFKLVLLHGLYQRLA